MKKQNRKKQLRHQAKKTAFIQQVQEKQGITQTQSPLPNRGASRPTVPKVTVDISKVTSPSTKTIVEDYLETYHKELEEIEKSYNASIDRYVEEESEKRYIESLPPEPTYPEFEVENFASQIRALELNVSKNDIRVVPSIPELSMMVRNWKLAFNNFMNEIPENYEQSDFGEMARDEFLENITQHFIDNQENPVALMNYTPNLKMFVDNVRQRYISAGTDYVLNNM